MKSNRTRMLQAVAMILLLGGATLHAQTGGSFDLSWSTVEGGAGSSTGGGYSVSATIGQSDAGAAGGGNFAVVGGFWAIPTLEDETAPSLHIARSGDNVIISWPNPSSGFQLEQCFSLSPIVMWSEEGVTPLVVGNEKQVTVSATSANRFFRLKKQ